MSDLIDLLHHIIDWLVAVIGAWGYMGIFLLMFVESSFFPFPSEVVMIPAGYLSSQGEMNALLAVIVGTVGAIGGAWLNYLIAAKFGRAFLGRFISHEKLDKMDAFFEKHGPISTFNGRLIPLFRQYISFPAGLARMDGAKFTLYTGAGAGIWVAVLVVLGYVLGENQDLVEKYLKQITIGVLVFVVVSGVVYFFWHRKNHGK